MNKEQIEHKIDDFINKEGVSAYYYRYGKKYIIECRKSMLIDFIHDNQPNVGMLRQYLNERVGDDLITNETIESFLNIKE